MSYDQAEKDVEPVPDQFTKILATVLMLAVPPAAAAQLTGLPSKSVSATRVSDAPIIDGSLDDAVWSGASYVDDLHEVSPNEFAAASEYSRFFVVVSDDSLYIGARLYDREPEKIVSQVLRQGDVSAGDDSIRIILDPFNNGRSGYWFSLNANDVRSEALFANVTEENPNWQGIWHGEAVRDDEGWTAEIQIPFKTLSFDPANDTWGVNFSRRIGRRNEDIGWVSYNRAQNPANSGKLSGMAGLEQGLGLDVVPGISVNSETDYLATTEADSVEPSLDVFYKPTPAMTAALTINTDFAGTSADVRQINLTRFSVFFPEKRLFFLQDTDIFEFGRIGGPGGGGSDGRVIAESGRPFFSRRIGLNSDGETIDIEAGLKLTGRIGRWDYGILDIQQSDYVTAELESIDSRNLFVGRVAANVLEESTVGVIATYGDPRSNLDNALIGADFRYLNTRLPGSRTLVGAAWVQKTDTENLEGDDVAYGFSLETPNTEGWNGKLSFREFQENYNPALGFVRQTNIRDYEFQAGYTWRPENSWVRTIESGINARQADIIDGRMDTRRIEVNVFRVENNRGDLFGTSANLHGENLTQPFEIAEGVVIPAGDYSWSRYCLRYGTGEQRKFRISGYFCDGQFYDGTRTSAGPTIVWRPSRHFRMEAAYRGNYIDLPYGSFIARLITVNADIAFSSRLFWENLFQFDNISNNLGINSILRWVPLAGREVVFVVNREFVDFEGNRNFVSSSSDLTAKASYTFRF